MCAPKWCPQLFRALVFAPWGGEACGVRTGPHAEICAAYSISQKDGKALGVSAYNMAMPPLTCKVVPVT